VADTITLESNKLDDYDYHYDDLPSSVKGDSENPLFKYGARNFIKKILYFSSGTDLQLIQNCPHSDKVKMQCIGGTVFATAVLAFLSGSFAFYTVFGPKPVLLENQNHIPTDWSMVGMSMFFGLIWSSIIFNLDRFIVSSLGHGDGTENITLSEWGKAVPRILMAIAIGVVISKPLELKIMDSEITSKLTDAQRELFDSRKAKVNSDYDVVVQKLKDSKQEKKNQQDMLRQEITAANANKDNARTELAKETDGSGGTGKKGCAASCEVKKTALKDYTAESEAAEKRNTPLIDSLETEIRNFDNSIKEQEEKRSKDIGELKGGVSSENGLMARLKIVEENDSYRIAGYFITALMIMLEISPLIFKMMITLSPYDYVQENIKLKSIARRGILLNDKGPEIKLSDSEFYEAELIQAEQKGKSEIEIELLKEAHSIFKDDMKEKMRKDPHRFIDLVRMESGD